MRDETKKLLGKRIRQLRKLKGYKQNVFAEIIGVDPKHLSAVENGKTITSLNRLDKIADTLDVQIKVFFEHQESDDDEKNKIQDMINIASNEQLRTINKVVSAITMN